MTIIVTTETWRHIEWIFKLFIDALGRTPVHKVRNICRKKTLYFALVHRNISSTTICVSFIEIKKVNCRKMTLFQRELLKCFICLVIASFCVNNVKPFVLNGKSEEVTNKSSELFRINPSDIENGFSPNILNIHKLQKANSGTKLLFPCTDIFVIIKRQTVSFRFWNIGRQIGGVATVDGVGSGGYGGGIGGGHHGGGLFKNKRKHHNVAFRRIIYPVLMGLLIAKMILFPLLLKALTIMSSASFVLSKMSLLSTIMLGFKWFLTQNVQSQQESKVEVVHLPMRKHQNPPHEQWDRDADNKYMMPMISENNDNYYHDHDMNLKPTAYVK